MRRAQVALKLAALCLHYPDRETRQRLRTLAAALPRRGLPGLDGQAARELAAFCAAVKHLSPTEWEARYVAAFDFKKEQALYLTFHEEGENIRRCSRMVALKQQIEAAGFRCPTDELPDFIPLLLEYLAVAPAAPENCDLEARLAAALHQIADGLAAGDLLYLPVIRAALTALPTTETGVIG